MKDLSKRAKEIIKQVEYVTIATVDRDGMPWNAPVFTAYDEYYSFYWGTHSDSQKSRNIKHNPNVFLVIYDSTAKSGTGEGVYIKAVAKELTDPEEIQTAFKLLEERHEVPFWEFAAIKEGPIRLYKATPQQVWMNDGDRKDGHYIDIRTEIIL